jgi:hypothetical protein
VFQILFSLGEGTWIHNYFLRIWLWVRILGCRNWTNIWVNMIVKIHWVVKTGFIRLSLLTFFYFKKTKLICQIRTGRAADELPAGARQSARLPQTVRLCQEDDRHSPGRKMFLQFLLPIYYADYQVVYFILFSLTRTYTIWDWDVLLWGILYSA